MWLSRGRGVPPRTCLQSYRTNIGGGSMWHIVAYVWRRGVSRQYRSMPWRGAGWHQPWRLTIGNRGEKVWRGVNGGVAMCGSAISGGVCGGNVAAIGVMYQQRRQYQP